jgi:hypothetical protein
MDERGGHREVEWVSDRDFIRYISKTCRKILEIWSEMSIFEVLTSKRVERVGKESQNEGNSAIVMLEEKIWWCLTFRLF